VRIDVITLFPEMVEQVINYGVVGRAADQSLLDLECWNPRDYTVINIAPLMIDLMAAALAC